MDYLLSLDAGGTKISVSSYSPEGTLLDNRRCTGRPFSTDYDEAVRLLIDAIDSCVRSSSGKCLFIAVGASGIRASGAAAGLEADLAARFHVPCRVVDDGVMALYANFNTADGILIISGTGSVCYGKKDGVCRSAGGWGLPLDDRGSGAWIALEAVRSLLARFDRGCSPTALDRAVMEHLACERIFSIPYAVARLPKSELASLAPVVETAANGGDTGALTILENAGRALSELVLTVRSALRLNNAPVAVSGSILTRCLPVRQAMMKALDQEDVRLSLPPELAVFPLYKEVCDD